jgi:hypothetical protein
MRVGLRAAALVAVFTSGLAFAPALAAPRATRGTFVLSGTGASYVDVSFARGFSLVPQQERKESPAGWRWSGCGRVRGFYLQPLFRDAMHGVGAVDLADLRFGAATDVSLPGTQLPRVPFPLGSRMLTTVEEQSRPRTTVVSMPAGRYRAHLLGVGACTVSIPVDGVRGTMHRTTRHASRMQYAVQSVGLPASVPAVPGPRAGAATIPVTVSSDTFVVALLHEVSYRHDVGMTGMTTYETCVELDAAPGCSELMGTRLPGRSFADPSAFYHQSVTARPTSWGLPVTPPADPATVPVQAAMGEVGTWYAPGWLVPGNASAKVVVAATPTTTTQAAMFALDLR